MQQAGHRILVVVCTEAGISKVARPLRSRGCVVQTCADVAAARTLLERRDVDLVLVERDDQDVEAIPLLRRCARTGGGAPCVLVTPLAPRILEAVINETPVARVVSAAQSGSAVVEDVLAVAEAAGVREADGQALAARCQMLEEKIDHLVRGSVQRERVSRLFYELLVEIENADGADEVASRCLARVVTAVRLDLAFIVLPASRAEEGDLFHSFGCPREPLARLRQVPWRELNTPESDGDGPLALTSVLDADVATPLSCALRIEGFQDVFLFPLQARRPRGFLGFASRERRATPTVSWERLRPIAKQIGIAIESWRLVEAASSAEALARGVVQSLPLTVAVCDRAGTVLQWFDPRAGRGGGRSVEGSRLADLVSPADADVLLQPVAAVARGADPTVLRALRLRLLGRERVVNVNVAPLPRNRVVLIIEDVTQRESVVGDLRRARALTSSLFANAPAGVIFLRQSGEVIDINETACSILRRTRKELLGESLADLFPDLWQTAGHPSGTNRDELTFRVGSNAHATVSLSATRVGRSGRPAGILLQLQDVGELQALREELRRRDNLALMGQMVSFIAHEIKNPLFGVSSAAQVIAREAHSVEANRLSTVMLSEIERLSQMLEELLVFGSRREIEPVEGDPSELCGELATIHRTAAAAREVDLTATLEPPRSVIRFDEGRLRQVLANLIGNALDATPEGGRIELSARQVDSEYVIDVVNSGEPIPPEERRRVFDLFYSTKARGNGLGLPICKKIVEDHGGRIELRSSRRHGTCFSVLLPVA